MGILDSVNDEHAGIIPRAISQVFDYVYEYQQEGSNMNSGGSSEITVSLSFLQLYRETIQDLLAPSNNSNGHSGDENLLIREDPTRGFYVDGLQEYAVRSYREAGNSCFRKNFPKSICYYHYY